jgi:hypothetical protein
MPLIHISMRAGKPEAWRQAIFDGIYRAMPEALDVPRGDAFTTITEHDAASFRYGNAFGINRSDDSSTSRSPCSTPARSSRSRPCSAASPTCSAPAQESAPRMCS